MKRTNGNSFLATSGPIDMQMAPKKRNGRTEANPRGTKKKARMLSLVEEAFKAVERMCELLPSSAHFAPDRLILGKSVSALNELRSLIDPKK